MRGSEPGRKRREVEQPAACMSNQRISLERKGVIK